MCRAPLKLQNSASKEMDENHFPQELKMNKKGKIVTA